METSEKRVLEDRRKQPTPGLSRYTFFGRRKNFRRRIDKEQGGYVDLYSSSLFFFLILLIGLNVLDALFTMMILEMHGWWELNPFVRSVMELCGDKFWIWKFAIVSVSSVLLCLHSRFKRVRTTVICISLFYLVVIIYQVIIIRYQ